MAENPQNSGQGQESTNNTQNIIIGGLAAVLVLVGAYMAYKHLVVEPKEKSAAQQMYKAEQRFMQDSFALALENPGDNYEGFVEIVENYSGTKAANLAKYYAGVSYLNLGRFDDAIDYLEDFSAAGKITPSTKNGALADAYAEKGDLDKALSLYEKASNTDNEALAAYYLYKTGLLATHLDQKDKAQQAFEKLNKEYPKSSQATEAKKYLGKLN